VCFASRCCIWSKPQTGSDHHSSNGSGPNVTLSLWSARHVVFVVVQRLMLRLSHACHHPANHGKWSTAGGRRSRFADVKGSTPSVNAMAARHRLMVTLPWPELLLQAAAVWRPPFGPPMSLRLEDQCMAGSDRSDFSLSFGLQPKTGPSSLGSRCTQHIPATTRIPNDATPCTLDRAGRYLPSTSGIASLTEDRVSA
jgi:hypothetical protein